IAVEGNVPAMRPYDLACHCQADADAVNVAFTRCGAADELLKDDRLFIERYSHAAIAYSNLHVRAVLSQVDPDCVTFGRVFHRIFKQVPEHTSHRLPVRVNHGRVLDFDFEAMASRLVRSMNSAADWRTSVAASSSSKRNCNLPASRRPKLNSASTSRRNRLLSLWSSS